MKIIDRSQFRDEEGIISLENRIKGTLQYGLGWYTEMQAQEFIAERLSKNLGKEHTLILNAVIPGTTITIPLILLSPQGVRVILGSPLRGVFRAKGEDWLKFDSRSRRFTKSKPNPQNQTEDLAHITHRYLEKLGYLLPEVEAVLIFSNPRTHVDHARPKVRIVQADAIDHFAANLQKLQPIMDQEDIHTLTDALINPKLLEPAPPQEILPEEEADVPLAASPEPEPMISFDEGDMFMAEPETLTAPMQIVYRLRSMGLERRQWILLGVMAFFEIIVLIILFMIVISNTLYS
jgi:hypothetical protein